MLHVQELRKTYGAREAVAGVSFDVAPGEIVGLLGPNGAGKTTTVSMICGLVRPSSGSAIIDGQVMGADASAAKRRVGLVPQDLALYEDLPAIDNLRLFGALYGMAGPQLQRRSLEALSLVGLEARAKERPRSFSGGMKRRLNIACALVHDPQLLILDEPTVGVDPQSRNAIFDNLEQLRAGGKALVYTTHYMEEVERLCDRIVILDHGKLVASDTLQGLYRRLPATETLDIEVDQAIDTAALAQQSGVRSAIQAGNTLTLGVEDLVQGVPTVLTWLASHGHRVHRIDSGQATLEDVFLALTGRKLRD